MKKIVFILFFIFSVFVSAPAFANDNSIKNITGRWAEKISERVVADIYQNGDDSEYRIFISWREDKLAQKDIYRFKAKLQKDGTLTYKDGVHILRYYDLKGNFEDTVNYKDGSGKFLVKDNEIVWFDNKDKKETIFIPANKDLIKDTTVKNKMFSFIMPEELKGLYQVKTQKNRIEVFDKSSKKAGFGGFAFGIKAYKNPSEHANLPGGRKIGEFTDKKGELYDMVLKFPTDVQYDYTKNSVPDSYEVMYNLGNFISPIGLKGAKYLKNQGMKGVDLYREIIKKHIAEIIAKTDSSALEEKNMSYMYYVLAKSKGSVLDKIGYAYYDTNGDGIDELLIGEITKGDLKGVIYDIYTMVNRTPKHVISGGTRNRYFVCDDSFICNEYSSGALESGVRVYSLVENSDELLPQVSFKYDAYENKKNPWFLSYGDPNDDKDWKNVDKKTYKERKSTFEKYERFDFTPLSRFK